MSIATVTPINSKTVAETKPRADVDPGIEIAFQRTLQAAVLANRLEDLGYEDARQASRDDLYAVGAAPLVNADPAVRASVEAIMDAHRGDYSQSTEGDGHAKRAFYGTRLAARVAEVLIETGVSVYEGIDAQQWRLAFRVVVASSTSATKPSVQALSDRSKAVAKALLWAHEFTD